MHHTVGTNMVRHQRFIYGHGDTFVGGSHVEVPIHQKWDLWVKATNFPRECCIDQDPRAAARYAILTTH